jgi:hypothetical protein
MPSLDVLTDDEIATILTYVRGSWSNSAGPVKADLVATVRAGLRSRTEPWSEADLRQFLGPKAPTT